MSASAGSVMRLALLVSVVCGAGVWGQVVQLRLPGACNAQFETTINGTWDAVMPLLLSFLLSFFFLSVLLVTSA